MSAPARSRPPAPSASVRVVLVVTAALASAPGAALPAQVSELVVEVGGSRVLPPSGVEGDAAAFVVAGLRGSRYRLDGTGVHASFLAGRALDEATGGDFLSGAVGGAAWRRLGGGWALGVEADAFAFGVEDPFAYRAAGLEGATVLRWQGTRLRARLAGVGGVGRSRVTVSTLVQRRRGREPVEQVLEDDLWRVGGTAELLAGGGVLAAGLAAGIHRSAAGTYRSAGARVVSGVGGGAVELRVDAWDTPLGTETTGGVAFHLPWGGWSVRGTAGRPEPDPLILAEPGRGAGGLLVGRRILGGDGVDPDDALYRAVARTERGVRVRFRLPVEAASGVELMGDFTLWEPVAMEPGGGAWWVEVDVPAGTHHYGFLVDGTWHVPEDAPDAVPDEWGRRSLTLVVDEEEGS